MAMNTMWPRRTEQLQLREMETGDITRLTQIRQVPGVDCWLLNDAVELGWIDEYEYAILREEWLSRSEG